MTKKFWEAWKNRIDETYLIWLYESVIVNGKCHNGWNILNHVYADDKIIKATFKGDTVDLVIKKFSWVIGGGKNSGHLRSENLYITLDRKNIKTIEFNRKL